MSSYFQKNILENHFLIALGVAVVGWLLWEIRGILISLFVAHIISTALTPAVEFLVAKKLNRTLSVILVFLTAVAVIALVIIPLIPFVLTQTQSFIKLFPRYLERAGQIDLAGIIQSEMNSLGRNAFFITSKVFGGVFSSISTLVISFYFLLNREGVTKFLSKVIGNEHQIDNKLGAWVRGQLLLSLIIGVFTWLGLTVIGVPQAVPLAIIAGALEIIPTLGPIISAIPALIVAAAISPTLAIFVVVLYIIIQQLENQFIVPKVMQEATGLNPIIVIIGVMIGGNLMGVLGALLAIPFLLVAQEIVGLYGK